MKHAKPPGKPAAKKAAQAAVSLTEITKGIRAAQAAQVRDYDQVQKALGRWSEKRKYSAVEIGWQLLRAILLHRSDDRTRFKPFSTGVENVSTPEPQALTTAPAENGGFYAWLAKEHADIEPRTARNYMNAARNVGLTAESTAKDVAALRKGNKLADMALAKLYRAVEGDADPQPTIAEQVQARRLMAEMTIMTGRGGLLNRVHDLIIADALFAELSGDQIERLYRKLSEATDKVAEHRPNARKAA